MKFLFSFSSTSKKHNCFVSSPMGDKSVTALPGIGRVMEDKLKQKGFEQASQIFGSFLMMKKDKDKFTGWLQTECGIGARYSERVQDALQEWSQHYL